jgi:hypothetical protein
VACRRGQFYDLLTNACWSCGNGWNRSIFPIKGSQACHKPPRLEHKKATYIRKGAACDAGKLEFFDLPTWSCWSCGKGYNRTLLPIKGRNACVQGIGGKYKKAKVSHYRKCAAGQFVDIRNGGECWSCPAGYNRHITPITGKDACIPRKFCDAGMMQYNVHKPAGADGLRTERYAKCAKRGACGKKGQRPCYVWERLPSCNSGLYEDFESNTCVTLKAGELPFFAGLSSLSREAGNIKEYCKKALYNVPAWKDAQKWVDSEDRLALKAFKADQNCRKDFMIGFLCQSTDMLSVATAPAGIINEVTAAGNRPPCSQGLSITTARATVIKGKARGVNLFNGCGLGAFWDPIDNGSCWRCPAEYKRHITHVKGPNACIKAGGFPQLLRGSCAVMHGLWGNTGSSLGCITGLIGSGKFGTLKDLFSSPHKRAWNTPCTTAGSFGFEVAIAVATGGAATAASGAKAGASGFKAAVTTIKGLITKLTTKHATLTTAGRVRTVRNALDTMKTIAACKPYTAGVAKAVAADPALSGLGTSGGGKAGTSKPALVRPMKAVGKWKKLPGKGRDISVGANGAVFMIGPDFNSVFRWNAKKKNWGEFGVGIARVAVGLNGQPWGINKSKKIWRRDGRKWTSIPGTANDIGIGANGKVWIIGTKKQTGGYGIFRWDGKWTKIRGAAVRIAVDPRGNAWAVDSKGSIFRYNGRKFVKVPGWGSSITVAANGDVIILGKGGVPFRRLNNRWVTMPGNAVNISAGPQGKPWVVGSKGSIFAWDGAEKVRALTPKPRRPAPQPRRTRKPSPNSGNASAMTKVTGFAWKPVSRVSIPKAITAGKSRGRDVLLCHGKVRGQTYVGNVQSGVCRIGNSSGVRTMPRYAVLTGDAKRVTWVAAKNSKLPAGAFMGGELWKPGTPRKGLAVCRATVRGSVYAGYVQARACLFTRDTRSDTRATSYEVLVIK